MLPDEAEAYLAKHGVESQLSKVILAGYKSLQLIHYFTAGPGEVRAWTVRVSVYLYQLCVMGLTRIKHLICIF